MNTRTKAKGKGDGEEPRHDTAEEELDEWKVLAQDFCDDAVEKGFSVIICLTYTDPLSRFSHMAHVKRGSYYENVGAMECTLVELKTPGNDEE